MRKATFYSNGKLLLTSEYLVLKGAKALALPTYYGQKMSLNPSVNHRINWIALDELNKCWFQCELRLPTLEIITTSHEQLAQALRQVFVEIAKLNTAFIPNLETGVSVVNSINFPRNWGLGTSSTLINNMAQWAEVNAFELLENTFGGSGYDVACAQKNNPIIYQRNGIEPIVEEVAFNPNFANHLFFVYLNQKQKSNEAIEAFYKAGNFSSEALSQFSSYTDSILQTQSINEFEDLLRTHEHHLSHILNTKTIQASHFPDYFGQTKSLGAWGGDFILATGNKKTPAYFKGKGYHTVIPFQEMIL